ncbi:unnamed protein product [Boreogadus saida]
MEPLLRLLQLLDVNAKDPRSHTTTTHPRRLDTISKIDYLTVTKGPHLHMVPLIRARLRANEFTLGGSYAVFCDLPVCCRSVNTRSVSPCSRLTSPRSRRRKRDSMKTQPPTAVLFKTQPPATGWFKTQHPDTGWFKTQNPTTGWFKTQNPTTGWFKTQNPTTGWFKTQHPDSGWFKTQHPTTGWFKTQHPTTGWFKTQHPDTGWFKTQNPTTGWFKTQPPTTVLFKTQHPTTGLTFPTDDLLTPTPIKY